MLYGSEGGVIKEEEKKEKAAKPRLSFSLPFRTPKRKQGLGQRPSAAI